MRVERKEIKIYTFEKIAHNGHIVVKADNYKGFYRLYSKKEIIDHIKDWTN